MDSFEFSGFHPTGSVWQRTLRPSGSGHGQEAVARTPCEDRLPDGWPPARVSLPSCGAADVCPTQDVRNRSGSSRPPPAANAAPLATTPMGRFRTGAGSCVQDVLRSLIVGPLVSVASLPFAVEEPEQLEPSFCGHLTVIGALQSIRDGGTAGPAPVSSCRQPAGHGADKSLPGRDGDRPGLCHGRGQCMADPGRYDGTGLAWRISLVRP